jgi:hypothetical protein
MGVITRAINDVALYQLMRTQGKELKDEELEFEESAIGFLFDDSYTIPMDDFLVDIDCPKCEKTWSVSMSETAGKDSICPHCNHKTSWKHTTYEITENQTVKDITLKDLIAIWGVEDIDGFRDGVRRRIEEIVSKKLKASQRKEEDMAEDTPQKQQRKRKPTFREETHEILMEIEDMLIDKNEKYGDSALNPVRIFSKADPREQIRVRLDDKLSRLVRGNHINEDEDVAQDIIGYFILDEILKRREERKKAK